MTIGTDHGMPNIEQFLLFIRTLDWRKSEGENAFANVQERERMPPLASS